MTYATLMVHVQAGQTNVSLLQAVDRLAGRFQARVIGIAVCQPIQLVYSDGFSCGDVIEQDRADIEHAIAVAETEFRTELRRHEAVLEWRSAVIHSPLAEFVAHAARRADLVMTGATTDDSAGGTWCASPGDIVMQAGRPVVVVPSAFVVRDMDRVVLGWKDTREARRAALDALPMLKKAKDVGVVAIVAEADAAAMRVHLDEVAGWLKQHGIVAETVLAVSNGEDSARLSGIANDRGADLVVAGAYGHSRVREWAFGGVTRDLLLHADRCSLLSH